MHTIGWPGIAGGIGIFAVTWLIVFLRTKQGNFSFEPTDGFFDKILPIYLDIAKFIMGLAAGGIVLIIGSSAFSSPSKRLPSGYVSPLFLLAGDSGARRTGFLGEREKRSGVKTNRIPG
jgi:hypothetical protein